MEPVLVTQALNALYGIASLAIIALGLAVVLGLLGVLNIAHGELVMIGAYCAYVVQSSGWPYLAAIPLALAVCGALGSAPLVAGTLRRGGTRGGTAALLALGALVGAGLAFVPVVGYLEALAVPLFGLRLRRNAPDKHAGLRTLARD